jgi:hypothetical protein
MTEPIQLGRQQRKVYDYIKAHPGATTHDIQFETWVSYPSGRITEMRQLGVPIISIGQKKYGHSKPFEMYAIQEEQELLAASKEAVAQFDQV